MKFAIHQFRQFENASLRYADQDPTLELPARVGVWDKVVESDADRSARR